MKSWYLENYSPNITGYESDAIADYAQSNFNDVMETTFSDTVTLLNYDLSEQTEIQCVIQGNTADTRLKTMERQILCHIGTLKAGMYILYHGNYWLVTGRPDNNKSYEKCTLELCQYKLRWQNAKGEIIDRWCNATSSSKYGNGETGNNVIVLTDDSLTLLLPNDDESLLLGDRSETNQRRVFIDKKQIPTKVYKITREDDVLYDYGESGGIVSFIAKKTELNTAVDNQELRICDYITPTTPPTPENPDETVDLFAHISYAGSDIIRIGGSGKTFTASLTDVNGTEKTMTAIWTVTPNDYVTISQDGNSLLVKCDDEDLDEETITISVMDEYSGFSTSIEITLSVF